MQLLIKLMGDDRVLLAAARGRFVEPELLLRNYLAVRWRLQFVALTEAFLGKPLCVS